MPDASRICLTFDNLGNAKAIGEGLEDRPRPDDPGLVTGYPTLLRMLAERGLRATFFCEGWSIGTYRDVVEQIAGAGHEIALHGWQHEKWDRLDLSQAARCLDLALVTSEVVGVTLRGFRAPGGELGRVTPALLVERGFTFDASLPPAGAPEQLTWLVPGRLVNVPFQWADVDYFTYERQHRSPEQFTLHWREQVASQGRATFVGHVHVSLLDPGRREALGQVLDLFADAGGTVPAGVVAESIGT